MIPLKPYQESAVADLVSKCLRELVAAGRKSVVFKAPTGAGKTVMMQEALKRLAAAPSARERCFVWVSVGNLADQSRKSFAQNAPDAGLRYLELGDVEDGELAARDVLFLNWEMLKAKDRKTGEWKVLAMKDNERDANIPSYMAATREAGREVVLVVDESDVGTDSAKAQEIIGIFDPKLQVEVSATPDSKDYDARVEVPFGEVVAAGMLKTEIAVNPGLKDFADAQTDTDHAVLDAALAKRAELAAEFAARGAHINPLVCVQLPSESQKTSELDETKMARVLAYLTLRGITTDNGKLAVWLADDKANLETSGGVRIERPDSPVEVLIFKMAVARGWDCPRAHVLVMFREIGSVTFQKQTLGRILRTPEQKHYGSDLLDRGYVFTDLARAKIGVQEEDGGYVRTRWTVRKPGLECPALPSAYVRRADYNDLGVTFYPVVEEKLADKAGVAVPPPGKPLDEAVLAANRAKLAGFGDFSDRPLKDDILADGKILVDIDERGGEEIFSEVRAQACTQEELAQMKFDAFCRRNVRPQFGNVARSYTVVKESLLGALRSLFFGPQAPAWALHRAVLRNEEFFAGILESTRNAYRPVRDREVAERRARAARPAMWKLPDGESREHSAKDMAFRRYACEPACFVAASKGEEVFAKMLDGWDTVDWWWRNLDGGQAGLGVPYLGEDGHEHGFYPDFVVRYTDGTMGVFDTKSGRTLEEGRGRLKGLLAWLERVNASGMRALGGLVVAQEVGNVPTALLADDAAFEGWDVSRKDFKSLDSKAHERYDYSRFENPKTGGSGAKARRKNAAEIRTQLEAARKDLAEFRAAQEQAAEWDMDGLAEREESVASLANRLRIAESE